MNTLRSKAAMIAAIQMFAASAAHAVDYTYDALGRLRAESFANHAHILHTYDATGNRTERRVIPANATPNADLVTTLTLSPDPAAQGLPVTATITVQNLGPDPAADVQLTSTLPAAFLSGQTTATQGSTALNGQNLTASLGTIPAGETVTLTVLGTADGTANFLVEATATSPADSTPGNNTGSDNTTPAASANLALLRLHSGPQPLLSSGTAILAFTARNDGPATATGVEAEVTLPAQLTHVNSIGGTGVTVNGQVVTITLADLTPGAETTIFVLATPGGAGDFTTTVALSATEADPDATNNVDSVVSNVLAPTLTVTNTNDSGAGSLRQAILDANANPDEDRIAFAIPGAGVPTIAPATPLPEITQPVLIDGWSQPEFMVEINGSGQGANTDVLTISGSDVTLRALSINRGPRDGVLISSGDFANPSENIAIFACNVGVDPTGTIDRGNTGDGVQVTFANHVTIGGPETWQSCVISGNTADGINVTSGSGHLIQGNRIGCDVNGTTAIFNGSEGISFSGFNSLIGGTEFGEGNLVSGNRAEGVQLDGSRNKLFGNLIGTDITGTLPLPNGTGATINSQAGVAAGGSQNQIGGPDFAQRNVISGNNVENVRMQNRCLVIGNFIGLDITGTQAVGGVDPNAVGVRFNFSSATSPCVLGGFLPGHGNVISGNNSHGVSYNLTNVRGALVVGNLIGTTADGKTALPNGGAGVLCRSTQEDGNNVVGGTLAGAGNLISGNTASGIRFQNNGATPARTYTIQGNRVGVNVDGDPLGNGAHGIHLDSAQDNLVGGPTAGAGNLIAHNTLDGVSVTTGSAPALRNRISGNSIRDNGGLGIDLGDDGVTANDADDADDGPNGLQNFPVITLAESGSGGLTGTLQAGASQTVRVEFFASATADASGHGEGAVFLGHADLDTDVDGSADFVLFSTVPLAEGAFITATATDENGSTSEFSAAVTVQPGDSIADDEPPVIVAVPAGVMLMAGPGGTAELPDLTGLVFATDNKVVTSITQDPAPGTLLEPGGHDVTFTVQDAAANEAQALAQVTVIEFVEPPAGMVTAILFTTGGAGAEGAVPGEPEGTIFTKFSLPVADGDDLGFLADIRPPGAKKSISVILGGDPIAVRVRAGDEAPDTSGALFSKLADPLFAGGSLTFQGTLKSGTGLPKTTGASDTGIWSDFDGALALIAREGGAAPGAGGAVFKAFTALSAAPDSLVFAATIKGAGVKSANNNGLWRHGTGGTELLLRKGDAFELEPGDTRVVSVIRALPPTVAFSPDQARTHGSAGEFRALVTFTNRSSGILVFPLDEPPFIEALTNDAPLDIADTGFKVLGTPASGGAVAAFLGTLLVNKTTVVTANDTGIFLGDENGFATVAREGGEAAGADGALFAKFADPVLSGTGAVTFLGTLKSGTGLPKATGATDTGLWTGTPGALSLLAREGGPAPEVGNGVTQGVFAKFLAHQTAPRGEALANVFLAQLKNGPGGVKGTSNLGLWAADKDGIVRLLARTGQVMSIGGAELPLRTLTALRTVKGTPGAGRGTSDTGCVVCLAGFTANRQAIVRVVMPR